MQIKAIDEPEYIVILKMVCPIIHHSMLAFRQLREKREEIS